jgi:hypothetical protein
MRSGIWNGELEILIDALLLIFGWRNLARGSVVGAAQAGARHFPPRVVFMHSMFMLLLRELDM